MEGQAKRWTGTWPLVTPKNEAPGVSGVQGARGKCQATTAVSRQGPPAGRPSGALSGVMEPTGFAVIHSNNFEVSSVHKENNVADPETLPDSQRHGQFVLGTPTPPAAAAEAPRLAQGGSRCPALTETASSTAAPLNRLGRVPLRPGTSLRLQHSISITSRQVWTSRAQQGD